MPYANGQAHAYDSAYRPLVTRAGTKYHGVECASCDRQWTVPARDGVPRRCLDPQCRSHARRRDLYRPAATSSRAYRLARAHVANMIGALRVERRRDGCDLRTAIARLALAQRRGRARRLVL